MFIRDAAMLPIVMPCLEIQLGTEQKHCLSGQSDFRTFNDRWLYIMQ